MYVAEGHEMDTECLLIHSLLISTLKQEST